MATIRAYGKDCAIVSSKNKDRYYGAGVEYSSGYYQNETLYLLQNFSFPEELSYRELIHAKPYFYCFPDENQTDRFQLYLLTSAFDPKSVTWNTAPDTSSVFEDRTELIRTAQYLPLCTIPFDGASGRLLRDNGVRLYLDYWAAATSKDSLYPPYLEIYCSDDLRGYDVEQTYPIGSATISKSIPTTFSWINTVQNMNTLSAPSITSGYFHWRVAGSASYTSKPVGSSTSITIPANTFSAGEIEWSVEVTASSGKVTTTPWVKVAVTEPTSTAKPVSPKNSVMDGTVPITFSWSHEIANGTKPTGYDLQTSTTGQSWTTLRSEKNTSATSVTVPANTFTSGDLYWRVRTYNLDGQVGSWSNAAHIIVIAAPKAPVVTVDAAEPRFQIRWQQTGQQAYEVMLNGVTIERKYSTASHYQYDGYLEPGTYTIQVRIQNQYSLWSDWGTLILTVTNTEGPAIALTAKGDNDVTLSWTGANGYSKYIVYRNGVKVAETTEKRFVDHFALGKVLYQVRGVYADSGNYTLSNEASRTVSVDTILIAAVDAPEWLRLDKSTATLRASYIQDIRSITYTHYVGSQLPHAEIGEAVSKAYDLDCAWKVEDTEQIQAFEKLIGKVVCIKTHTGRRIVGVLGAASASEDCMVVSYRATITLIDWEG